MRFFLFVFLAAFIGVSGLQAHRLPEALTTIEYNSNTGQTEIVHRLHLHDIEANLEQVLHESGQSLEALEGRARFAIYVRERFVIVPLGEKRPLDLSLLGAEMEGDSLYVYQEYNGKLPKSLNIRNRILHDVFSRQVNTVILKTDANQLSLSFVEKDEWKEVKREER